MCCTYLVDRSDKWSRTNSLVLSTAILIIFTALTAGSYYNGDTIGMFNIMTAWRFFVSAVALLESRAYFSDSRTTGWDRDRWRISSWLCGLRRIHQRAEKRFEEYVVHFVHQHHD